MFVIYSLDYTQNVTFHYYSNDIERTHKLSKKICDDYMKLLDTNYIIYSNNDIDEYIKELYNNINKTLSYSNIHIVNKNDNVYEIYKIIITNNGWVRNRYVINTKSIHKIGFENVIEDSFNNRPIIINNNNNNFKYGDLIKELKTVLNKRKNE